MDLVNTAIDLLSVFTEAVRALVANSLFTVASFRIAFTFRTWL